MIDSITIDVGRDTVVRACKKTKQSRVMNFVRRLCQIPQQHHVIFQLHSDNSNVKLSNLH
jgi:hypothetical protein